MTPARSDAVFLAIIAALHLLIGGGHQYAHGVAEVGNTPLQILFILIVITIAPWAAVYLAWIRSLRIGAILFSAAMAASFFFGLVFHFAFESPDLYSNVVPEHKNLFLHSALGLALVEFAGFVYGAHLVLKWRQPNG
ncbi:MAG: hypothetical protein OXI10_06030 [Gammaproteobacteria bacterium]|nr:hypothetical protein [Gammaproteobacteria bacterium]